MAHQELFIPVMLKPSEIVIKLGGTTPYLQVKGDIVLQGGTKGTEITLSFELRTQQMRAVINELEAAFGQHAIVHLNGKLQGDNLGMPSYPGRGLPK